MTKIMRILCPAGIVDGDKARKDSIPDAAQIGAQATRAYYDRAPGASAFSLGVAMQLTFRFLWGPVLLGPSLLGLSGMTLAAAAPRSSTGDDGEAKAPAVAELTES